MCSKNLQFRRTEKAGIAINPIPAQSRIYTPFRLRQGRDPFPVQPVLNATIKGLPDLHGQVQIGPERQRSAADREGSLGDTVTIRSMADIASIERAGLDAFLGAKTPFGLIRQSAERYPNHIALRYIRNVGDPGSDQVITYRELTHQIAQAASLFRRLGVRPQDSVAILAPHMSFEPDRAVGRAAGRPGLPDQSDAAAGSRRWRCSRAVGRQGRRRARQRTATSMSGTTIVPELRKSGVLTHILHIDSDAPTAGSDGCFEELLARENAGPLDFSAVATIPTLSRPSSTPAAPPVRQNSRSIRANQAFVARAAALMYDFGPDDVAGQWLPAVPCRRRIRLRPLRALGRRLDPDPDPARHAQPRFIETIWKKVEHLPRHRHRRRADRHQRVERSCRRCRYFVAAGDADRRIAAADRTRRRLRAHREEAGRNILGMTECAGVVTIEPFHGPRTAGSTGLRLPFTEVRAFRRWRAKRRFLRAAARPAKPAF